MLVRRGIWILLAALLAVPAVSSARRRPQHGNPHEEVTATARVESAPRRTRHRNGRSFEELDVLLLSVRAADSRGDSGIEFDTLRPVHVIHDLTCGGAWIDLAPGDRVSLKGEYVHPPSGRDLVHFTHPADSSCGGGAHPGGFLRREGAAQGADRPAVAPAALAAFGQASVPSSRRAARRATSRAGRCMSGCRLTTRRSSRRARPAWRVASRGPTGGLSRNGRPA